MQTMKPAYKPVFMPLTYTASLSPPPSPLSEVVISDAFTHTHTLIKNYTRAIAPRIPLLFRDKCAPGP
jgi:hypothetical protein